VRRSSLEVKWQENTSPAGKGRQLWEQARGFGCQVSGCGTGFKWSANASSKNRELGTEILLTVQNVTGLERKLAVDFHHLDVAVDGVDIHQADCFWIGLQRL
jgi:hypothetical protein